MKHEPIYSPSFEEVAQQYDAFILDLWGVVHDGKSLYPGTLQCLKTLRKLGKRVLFLSNAPRRAVVVEEALSGMGVSKDLYEAIITSGETAYQCLAHPEHSPFRPRGHQYIYIGLERDRSILDGLHYEEVKHPEHAQFVLLSHSFEDNQPLKTLYPLLEQCAKRALPVVCINPDKEVVRLSGERVYCAGALAAEYHMMGGEVVYFGKPHATVYQYALAQLQDIPQSRIIAVGDTLATDIQGGATAGLATVLVTGGVLREAVGEATAPQYRANCEGLFTPETPKPDYIIPAFKW